MKYKLQKYIPNGFSLESLTFIKIKSTLLSVTGNIESGVLQGSISGPLF